MVDHDLPFLANISMLFTEVPFLDRPAAARNAGFDAIECWWPWADRPVPSDGDVESFVHAVQRAGVRLVGLNFFGGDLAGADAGVLSIPSRSNEFRDNLPVAVEIGRRLGVQGFNALYGRRVDGVDPQQQDELAAANIALAAEQAATIGATVFIEPVSGPKPYPLRTAADAVRVVDQARAAGHANVGLLCDLYHLSANGDDVPHAITAYADRIAHVQLADSPGRGEPGSGDLPVADLLAALEASGYRDWVGLEYKPTTDTTTSLRWLPTARRRSAA